MNKGTKLEYKMTQVIYHKILLWGFVLLKFIKCDFYICISKYILRISMSLKKKKNAQLWDGIEGVGKEHYHSFLHILQKAQLNYEWSNYLMSFCIFQME